MIGMKERLRLRIPERRQVRMVMESLEDTIDIEHPVRLVWQVVERIDLSRIEAGIKARVGVVGRDSTDPRLLFALWLYATIRGVGSARELGRLCVESRPYRWLCGGVSVNYHTLADFRVDHGAALDDVFTEVIASLVGKGLVKVRRISQDGTRVRASAGASSFRRKVSLEKALEEAREQVAAVRKLLDDPRRSAGLSRREKAARSRAARERQQRVEEAIAQLPELERRQQELSKSLSKKQKMEMAEKRQPRVSTTDGEARRMKMPNGGYQPAVNFQLGIDTESRAIVGLDVTNHGQDTSQLIPMREQIEKRTGLKVNEHLADGGYLTTEDVKQADAQDVRLFIPPKPRRNKEKYGDEFTPKPGESKAVAEWRTRMGSTEGRQIYLERGSTVETVNGDLKCFRGLGQLRVRGLKKARCIGLWSALAYNVIHFASHLVT